jgi:tetratricopeptide (TPR) repeat protein
MTAPIFKRLRLVFCLCAGLAALSFATWSLHQSIRAGRVHFERGLDAAAAKRMTVAEREWQAGVREDPGFPDNYGQLGDLYSALGRFPEAAAQYRSAARLMPQDEATLEKWKRTTESAGDLKAALDVAERLAVLRPDQAATVGEYGVRAAKLNQPERALPPLKRAHTLDPKNADVLIFLVRVEFQLQDLAGAERDLKPFLESHPENAEACYLMAYLLHQKPLTPALLQTALDLARRAHAGAPSNGDAGTLLGQLELTAGNPAAALTAFRQAQAVTPHSTAVLQGILICGTRLHQSKLTAQATADLNHETARIARMARLEDRLKADPSDTAAALEMAHLREENHEWPQAQGYYEQAVHHAPQDPRARAAMARFLAHTQRPIAP